MKTNKVPFNTTEFSRKLITKMLDEHFFDLKEAIATELAKYLDEDENDLDDVVYDALGDAQEDAVKAFMSKLALRLDAICRETE